MKYSQAADKSYLIAELPLRERPRERLLAKGSEALSDTELLAIVLRTGPRGMSTLDLARSLLRRFNGSLVELASATPVELSTIRGIGKAKAAELKAVFSLASRMANHMRNGQQSVHSPEEVAGYFRNVFLGRKQEELRILVLNSKNGVITDELVTVGLVDRSQAHAREVFRAAIQNCASKIVLAHNHPSGDPSPSKEDIACTQNLAAAGEIVGIAVVDHVIMGTRSPGRDVDYFSFREHNLLERSSPRGSTTKSSRAVYGQL